MKEYKIRITGKYDVIVLSPGIIARLIEKIRCSDTKEMVIPAEEILPQGYAEYLSRVLEANTQIVRDLQDRNAYTLIADQIRNLQFDEQDCFDRVKVIEPEKYPLLDVETNKGFYIVTKQESSRFRFAYQGSRGEEISIVLEYLQNN